MSYSVKTLAVFEKQVKRLIKKYPSLKTELWELVKKLKSNPEVGTFIGRGCYKIRLAIASKGKGKSGGARVLIHIVLTEKEVYLLTIYDKSEKEDLSNKELQELLAGLPE
jgi:hypothetical protein